MNQYQSEFLFLPCESECRFVTDIKIVNAIHMTIIDSDLTFHSWYQNSKCDHMTILNSIRILLTEIYIYYIHAHNNKLYIFYFIFNMMIYLFMWIYYYYYKIILQRYLRHYYPHHYCDLHYYVYHCRHYYHRRHRRQILVGPRWKKSTTLAFHYSVCFYCRYKHRNGDEIELVLFQYLYRFYRLDIKSF